MQYIDKLTENKVYADPVKAIQEEMLAQLLEVRKSFASSIENAVQNGGAGRAVGETVSKADFEKLENENKQLKYRIKFLLRTLNEVDGGSVTYQILTDSEDSLREVRVVSSLAGAKIQVKIMTEDEMKAKDHIKANPTRRYPLL